MYFYKRKLNRLPFMPVKWMHKWLLAITMILLMLPLSSQNGNASNLDILLIQLEDALEKGNSRALRELAGIIDEVEDKHKIIHLLEKHTLFPSEQIQLDSTLNRVNFFRFLNEYESKIQYSPFLTVFFTKDIEDYEVDFTIVRKRNFSDKEKSSLLQRHVDILNAASATQLEVFSKYQLQEIANLQTYESYDFLLGCLEGRNLPDDLLKASYIKSNICEALTSYEDPFVLEIILEQLRKGKIEGDDAMRMLARFTNVKINEDNPKKLADSYTELLDSLETLSGLRNFGFEKKSKIRHAFFDEPVDYYAYMLSQFYDNPWMRENALREMMATGNPRALFYLSAVMFSERKGSSLDRKLLEKQFEEKLNITIQLINGNENENLNDNNRSDDFYLNHAIYWSTHYTDYEYDSDRRIFVNVKLEEENEASATRLFKKLTSENDYRALDAYRELSKFSPVIIMKLYEKYQSVLRRSNASLPDFRYGFLENLALLQEFCEVEGIEITLSPSLIDNLNVLKTDLSAKERYALENAIINSLELNEITALEIEGLINSKNIEFNFSVSRMLDIYYSRHFDKIVDDYFQLRLFLKKSILFSSIGVGGVSNKYFSKLGGKGDKVAEKLMRLSRKEYDEDIRDAIIYVLPEEKEEPSQVIPINVFLDEPLEFGNREFHLVEEPNNKALKNIFKVINASKKPEIIMKYFEYLSLHNTEDITPFLLNGSLNNSTILSETNDYQRTVSDAAILLLENIYDYSFSKSENQPLRMSADKWSGFYKRNKDLKEWNTLLFDRKVSQVLNKRKLNITDLNDILVSELCTPELEQKCLAALSKLNSHNNVRKLELNHLLTAENLIHFRELNFDNKYLDNVLELFEDKNANQLFDFIQSFVSDISKAEAGKIYNQLSDLDWFIPMVLNKESNTRKSIVEAMNQYLDEADFISEFEEKRIMNRVFIMKYGNQSIGQQIQFSKDYSKDEQQVYEIQQSLLAKVSYDELSIVVDYLDDLVQINGESSFFFLEKKLGLPSYLFETEKARRGFKRDIQNLSELEIYKKYLAIAGLEIFYANGELNYEKIREVLEFDVVSPFSSTVSRHRMHYIIGILRILNNIYKNDAELPLVEDEIRDQSKFWLEFLEQENAFSSKTFYYSFNHEE